MKLQQSKQTQHVRNAADGRLAAGSQAQRAVRTFIVSPRAGLDKKTSGGESESRSEPPAAVI